MHSKDETHLLEQHNTARYFVENRHIAWVLLVGVMLWGIYGYLKMPQRKDPDIPIRLAAVTCSWPGVPTDKVEDLITRKIEDKIAENDKVDRIESTTRTGLAVVIIKLHDDIENVPDVFDDIHLKLSAIRGLPEGASPINFIKDFGDTTSLMLTVASPLEGEVEISLRARQAESAIRSLRADRMDDHVSLVIVYPDTIPIRTIQRNMDLFSTFIAAAGFGTDISSRVTPGLAVFDMKTRLTDDRIMESIDRFIEDNLRESEFSPDIWQPALIRDPATSIAVLSRVAGSKYSFKQLEAYTEEIMRTLQAQSVVSRVTRWGVQSEAIYLEFSQERMAAYGIGPLRIKETLAARNIRLSGGIVESGDKAMLVDPSGEIVNETELGAVAVGRARNGSIAYLRDMVEIERGYETPALKRNYLMERDTQGRWRRMPAITLAVTMRSGGNIGHFSHVLDKTLNDLKQRLPEDLLLSRTSDQPRQVAQKVGLFMSSLYEAVILVVLVAFIGFREWRSALLMALSIPITLAMTFGMMQILGIDLQQISLAALILSLGLLVDDPVVANDAIKLELRTGKSPEVAAWLGPTKLATAIVYATITNIVAYLPYLMLSGDKGRFLYSMPVVIACSLVASRIVSMTFIPQLGRILLRPGRNAGKSMAELRSRGFAGFYYRLGTLLIDHRWKVLALSLVLVAMAFVLKSKLKDQFFPYDLSHLSYVDVWLPEDTPVQATDHAARQVVEIVKQTAEEFGAAHPGKNGKPRDILELITVFVGAGGPRYWFSVTPELNQPNYAQVLIEVRDVHDTEPLLHLLQQRLYETLPGIRANARRLESGPPVGIPVQIRLSGDDIPTLRIHAGKLKEILRAQPGTERIQDNWGAEIFRTRLSIDPDKAALAGITNLDVARSSAMAMNGFQLTSFREGRLDIPVYARMRMEERAGIENIKNLYVTSADGTQKVPLGQISTITWGLETEKIVRRNHFRTITVSCFPNPGVLSSEIIAGIRPALKAFEEKLPPGYRLEIGGEYEEQTKGFKELSMVLVISVTAIYLALLFQFKNAVKPLIVFAAIPYGMSGAFGMLYITASPFGFMAFLGIVSLIGVIVSHIIVLFDFIEERRAEGDDLKTALLDAGIMRLRPVMITVAATVLSLIPLALHGGPLWEPLCYAQIGGLTVATFVTLLMVPVIYAIVALDLKLVD
jgi:multidrug efflux pump subunit AcrB